MSKTLQKTEYICDCGKNYGSCGETGTIYLYWHGPSDTYQLLAKWHPGEKIKILATLTDNSISAITKLFNANSDPYPCTPEEWIELQNAEY